MIRRNSLLTMAAIVAALTGGQGCVTGYMYVSSDSFRERCEEGDSCAKAVAAEGIAEVGTALIVVAGALIVDAVNESDEPERVPTEEEIAAASLKEQQEQDEARRQTEAYPGWP